MFMLKGNKPVAEESSANPASDPAIGGDLGLPTGMRLKDRRYYLHVPVPKDVQQFYATKQIERSLKTRDLSVALERWAIAWGRLKREFAAHRVSGTVAAIMADPEKAAYVNAMAKQRQESKALDELYKLWLKKRDRPIRTRDAAKAAINRLPRKAPADITTADIEALVAEDAAKGLAPATTWKTIWLLRAIFTVAIKKRQLGITTNPASGVEVEGKVGEARPRGVWSPEDIAKFRAAYPLGTPLRALFEIGMWTGARLGEITRLKPEDIELKSPAHLWFIPPTGRRSKTRRRRVPLVGPEMIESAKVLAKGLPLSVNGKPQVWSKRFNDARRALGITKDFHTTRHSFKYYARASEMLKEHMDVIEGHAGGIADLYGDGPGYPLRPLIKALKKLRFEE